MFASSLTFVFVVVVMGVWSTTLAHGASTSRRLCVFADPSDASFLKPCYAVAFYGANYPSFNWTCKILGRAASSTNKIFPEISTRTTVAAWATNGTDCDVLVGPAFSYLATVISPLVEVLWIDGSATSTELSNKKSHPTFSRTMPSDAIGAASIVSMMKSLAWFSVNVLCVDEPYGRSVTQGVAEAMAALGGRVDRSLCVSSDATDDDVDVVFNKLSASDSRAVFIGALPNLPIFSKILAVIQRRLLHRDMVFLLAEAICSSSPNRQADIPGSFCYRYTPNATRLASFQTSYSSRNVSGLAASLVAENGFSADQTAATFLTATDIYGWFHLDAAVHAMSASHAAATTGMGNASSLIEFARAHVTEGITGTIVLDRRTGDRIAANVEIAHTLLDGSIITHGVVVNNVYQRDASASTVFLGTLYPAGAALPAVAKTVQTSDTTTIVSATVGASLGVGAVVVLAAVIVRMTTPATRDNAAAPIDETAPFAIAFTDIQSSTSLWARVPEQMSEAVEAHHRIMRRVLKKHDGYEVKTIGDSFMVAFKTIDSALHFALDVQIALHEHDWKDDALLDATYHKLFDEAVAAALDEGKSGAIDTRCRDGPCWRGLRVRVGLHFGHGDIKFDPTSLSYDYYGTIVNTAARVESIGHGGQILVTDDAFHALSDEFRAKHLKDKVVVTALGPQPLRGLTVDTPILQLVPCVLAQRAFPPLRLDVTDVLEENNVAHVDAPNNPLTTGGGADTPSDFEPPDGPIAHYYECASTILSTTKVAFRTKVLKQLLASWSIADPNFKRLDDPLVYKKALCAVASKAAKVSNNKSILVARTTRSRSQRGSIAGVRLVSTEDSMELGSTAFQSISLPSVVAK